MKSIAPLILFALATPMSFPRDVPKKIESVSVSLVAADTVPNAGATAFVRAKVLPEDAQNKSVDWDVIWAADAPLKHLDISEYIAVTPEHDGALAAKVICKKSFYGSTAYVRATTRFGKFDALCRLVFNGAPRSISLDDSSLKKGEGVNAFCSFVSYYHETRIPIVAKNCLGLPAVEHLSRSSVRLTAVGKFNVQDYTWSRGGENWAPGTEKKVAMADVIGRCLSAMVKENNLVISPKASVESYAEKSEGTPSFVRSYGKFRGYDTESCGSSGIIPHFVAIVTLGTLPSARLPFRISFDA